MYYLYEKELVIVVYLPILMSPSILEPIKIISYHNNDPEIKNIRVIHKN